MGKTCKFCLSEDLIPVHDHYIFCANCTAIYTSMILISKSCEHINDGSISVDRVPWYKELRQTFPYIIDDKCSECGKEAIADGW